MDDLGEAVDLVDNGEARAKPSLRGGEEGSNSSLEERRIQRSMSFSFLFCFSLLSVSFSLHYFSAILSSHSISYCFFGSPVTSTFCFFPKRGREKTRELEEMPEGRDPRESREKKNTVLKETVSQAILQPAHLHCSVQNITSVTYPIKERKADTCCTRKRKQADHTLKKREKRGVAKNSAVVANILIGSSLRFPLLLSFAMVSCPSLFFESLTSRLFFLIVSSFFVSVFCCCCLFVCLFVCFCFAFWFCFFSFFWQEE